MTNKRPAYKVKINPDDDISGVYAVSLVDYPAIESDCVKLAAQEAIEFAFSANKDKQMLFGPLLIPNKLIFRKDKHGNEFDIFFDEEVIQIIADKYNEKKISDVFNFMHSDIQVEAVLLQNWITGEIDKSQEFGFSLPKGTWFGGVKVKDEGFWLNEVKTDKVNGFSVEIRVSDLELVQLNKINVNIKLMEIKTKDGVSLYTDGELATGVAVFSDAEMTMAIADESYELEDGRTIVIVEGRISELKEVVAEDAPVADAALAEAPVDGALVENTPAGIDPQAVLDIVAPMFEEMRVVHGEMLAKIAELEAKISELEGAGGAVETLRTQVELLAKTPAAESITKKVDERLVKKEEILMSKIKAFGQK